MLFLMCPCGEILGNKQLVYEERMKKVCEKYNVDYNMVSQGLADRNEDFRNERANIVNSVGCRRYCCKQLLITYVDIVHLIKG